MSDRQLASNLAELYRSVADRWGDRPAFATRGKDGSWNPLSFGELYRRGLALATALIDLGVEARDHVGHFGDNRQEWILADYGVQLCGAADVPRGRDITEAELAYIVNHAGIRVAFVETDALLEKVVRQREAMPNLQHVILLDPEAKGAEGVLRLTDVIDRGETLREGGDRRAEERIRGIRPDDLFTLIYTSGTTGQPKGVMLTHANMMSQMATIPIDVGPGDRILSILPVWHIFERVFEVLSISCGACTYYSSIRTLGEDLKSVKPTFMGSAPRLWESLHQRILKNVEASPPVRQKLFRAAYAVAHRYQQSVFFLTGRKLALEPQRKAETAVQWVGHGCRWALLLPAHFLLDAVVLKRIREGIGGALKATVSGGGALPVAIDDFFNAVGIPVLEGYGLTESSPVIAVRTHEAMVVGTVGPAIPQTEVRIVDPDSGQVVFPNPNHAHGGRGQRGEIVVRGPQVMKGYYREPEMTAKTLPDGWLRTGDLGTITFNGCLKILGRCKETIVLMNGENLEPGPIEMRLLQSPFIDQCMVVGQDRKFIGALIVPSTDSFRERGIAVDSPGELAEHPEAIRIVREEIRQLVSQANGFKAFERIQDFRLLPEPFTVGDELTNLFKLKRHVVTEKYADLIDDIFKEAPRASAKSVR